MAIVFPDVWIFARRPDLPLLVAVILLAVGAGALAGLFLARGIAREEARDPRLGRQDDSR